MKNGEIDKKMLEELKSNIKNRKRPIEIKEVYTDIIVFGVFVLIGLFFFFLSVVLKNESIMHIGAIIISCGALLSVIIWAYYMIFGVLIKGKYKYIEYRYNKIFEIGGRIKTGTYRTFRKIETGKEAYEKTNKQNEVKQFNININTNIINKILESFDKEYIYIPDKGIERQVVEDADFEEFDVYYTNDLIEGKFKNCTINIAEILTDYDATKKNNPENIETYKYIFTGIFANIKVPKNLNTALYTRRKSKKYSNLKEKNIKEVSFKELKRKSGFRKFKRRFNIYTLDNSAEMEILTPDVIEILVKFFNETKINYEITIKNNNIYIRFETKYTMFEIESKKDIYIFCKIIEFIHNLIEKLVKE